MGGRFGRRAGALARLTLGAAILAACGTGGGGSAAPAGTAWPATAAPSPSPSPAPSRAPGPTLRPTQTPAPSPSTDIGSLFPSPGPITWTRFVSKLGYSISRPESWIESSDEQGGDAFLLAYGSDDAIISTGGRMTIRRGPLGAEDTLAKLVKLVRQFREEEFGCDTKVEDITLDGRTAKLVLCIDGTTIFGSYDIVVVRGSRFYDLVLTFDRVAGAMFGAPDELDVLRQVAATFRFR